MDGIDGGRLATQGKSHKRKGAPSAETASLLAEWQETLRTELRAVTVELRGKVPDPGLGIVPVAAERPQLTDRIRLVELGVKVATALGTEVDRRPPEPETGPARPRRRARVDYG